MDRFSVSRALSCCVALSVGIFGEAMAAEPTNGNESDDASYSLFDNGPNSLPIMTGEWGGQGHICVIKGSNWEPVGRTKLLAMSAAGIGALPHRQIRLLLGLM
ncbi:hypothetical protein ACTVH1_09330 [Gluconobacter cerinus]